MFKTQEKYPYWKTAEMQKQTRALRCCCLWWGHGRHSDGSCIRLVL